MGVNVGVKLSIAYDYIMDMREEFDFHRITRAASLSGTSVTFTVNHSNFSDQFRGSGFKYDSSGNPTAGTISSLVSLFEGRSLVLLSGLSIAATKLISAAKTSSTSDDLVLVREAFGGDDILSGGDSTNYLRGYAGNDSITGGQDTDTLFGDDGDDSILGGEGSDKLYGGSGNDTLNGGIGEDVLSGGSGSDTASYLDALEGVTASLRNPGSNTNDAYFDQYFSIENLKGTDFADRLEGNAAVNILIGGGDDDTLIGRAGGDTLRGGNGADTASYAGAAAGVIANLTGPSRNTNDAAGDVYSSIENLTGSSHADGLFGNGGANSLIGGGGDDSLVGYAGEDNLYGGTGADRLFGGDEADRLFGGDGADRFMFKSVYESSEISIDTIFDFLAADGDTIDLSAVDANSSAAGNQAFTFIGTAEFSDFGQVRYEKTSTETYVYADVTGDGTADLIVRLDDSVTLTGSGFVL